MINTSPTSETQYLVTPQIFSVNSVLPVLEHHVLEVLDSTYRYEPGGIDKVALQQEVNSLQQSYTEARREIGGDINTLYHTYVQLIQIWSFLYLGITHGGDELIKNHKHYYTLYRDIWDKYPMIWSAIKASVWGISNN